MRRVVKSSFQAGNIGGAKCGVSEGLVLVCAAGRGLHSLDLGVQGGWDIRVIRIDNDVARLNTGTGKVEEVESGLGVVRLAGCGGVVVTQGCGSGGRDNQGQAYCKKYDQEI